MSQYIGETFSIPLEQSGFCHNKNTDIIAPTDMVHPSRNIWLHEGGIRKRGGTAHLDTDDMYDIGDPVITGNGLDDLSSGTVFTGTPPLTFTIEITAEGAPDTFKWMRTGGSWTTGVSITGSEQTLEYGFKITFAATTGHTLGDKWAIKIFGTVLGLFDFTLANDNEFIVRALNGGSIWKDEDNKLDIFKVGTPVFTGSGLDDLSAGGSSNKKAAVTFKVQIDNVDAIKESSLQGSSLGQIKTSSLCNAGIKTSSLGGGGIKTSGLCSNGIQLSRLNNGGVDYLRNDTFTVDGGSTLAEGKVVLIGYDPTLDNNGMVRSYEITSPGAGYSAGAGIGTTTLSGIGIDLTIDISIVSAGGSGYAVNDTFTINGGSTLATGKVLTVAAGVVATYEILTAGAGYTVEDAVNTTRTSGAGTGLLINILTIYGEGSGYAVGDTFTVDGGSTLATGKILSISGSAVTSYEILTPGAGYSVASNIATTATSGSGTGFTVNILTLTGDGGSGYAANDTFTVNGGTTLATGKVLTVSSGVVATYEISTVGAGYSVETDVGTTATSGSGTGLKIDILTLSGGGGTGYAVDDVFNVDGGTTAAVGVVLTIGTGGVVVTYELSTPGAGFSVGAVDTTATTGQGTGLELDVTILADTFKWLTGAGGWTTTKVLITGGWQTLEYEFQIKFGALIGHTVDEYWTIDIATGLWTEDKIVSIVQSGDTILISNGADLPVTWNGSDTCVVAFADVPADWSGSNYPKQIILHGRLNSLRGWAIGCLDNPKNVYVSANDDVTDFAQDTVLSFNIETGDGAGLMAGVEFGDRVLFFGKRQSFVMDDEDYNTDNWGYFASPWTGGVAHHRLLVRTPNDLVAMMDDGEIYSVTAAEKYGDYKAASLSRPSYIHEWMKQYLDLTYISDFHAIYDPSIRAIKFFVVRSGSSTIDTCLCYYIDRPPATAWTILGNQDYESGYSAASTALHRLSTGLSKIYTGGYNGKVWQLGESDRNDNSESFETVYKTPPMSFGNVRELKRYDCIRIVSICQGEGCICTVTWSVDGADEGLDGISTVTFAVDGGDSGFSEQRIRVGRMGKRIQLQIVNDTADEDCYFSQILIDFTVAGKTLNEMPPITQPPV